MISNLLQKVYWESIHQYVCALVMLFFGALTSIYIIRKLSIEDYGVYNFIVGLISIAQFATSFGLGPTLQRYLPEYRDKENHYLQKRMLSISMLIRMGGGIAFVSLLLFNDRWIMHLFNLPQSSQKFFPIVALIILLVLECQLLGDAALVALLENKYWNLSRTAYTSLKFFLFYFSLSKGYGIQGIIWSWLLSQAFLFLLFLFKAYEVIFSLPVKKEDIRPLPVRRFINFGGYLILQQSTWVLRDTVADIFLISYFLGTHHVGLYSFAFCIPLMLMNFSPGSRLRSILTPFFVHTYIKTNDKQQLIYFFGLINKIIFFTMIPIFIILIILADKIILYVFNPKYLVVTNLFMLSLGFVMIQQFAYPYKSIFYTLEKTKVLFVGTLFALYNLMMDIILIPCFGILGAILATGSAGIMLPFYYYIVMRKVCEFELKYPLRAFLIFSLNTIMIAILAFSLRGFVNNIASLISVIAIVGIAYLILSYVNKGFDDTDRQTFRVAIGRQAWVP